MANSVDPVQTTRSVASDLGLHCLERKACLSKKLDSISLCRRFVSVLLNSVLQIYFHNIIHFAFLFIFSEAC